MWIQNFFLLPLFLLHIALLPDTWIIHSEIKLGNTEIVHQDMMLTDHITVWCFDSATTWVKRHSVVCLWLYRQVLRCTSSASRTKISNGRADLQNWICIWHIVSAWGEFGSGRFVTNGGLSWNESRRASLREKFQVRGKKKRPVLSQVVRKEYKFSLMQSDEGAQKEKWFVHCL